MPLVSVAAAYQAADVAAKADRIVIKGKRGEEPYVTVLMMTTNYSPEGTLSHGYQI